MTGGVLLVHIDPAVELASRCAAIADEYLLGGLAELVNVIAVNRYASVRGAPELLIEARFTGNSDRLSFSLDALSRLAGEADPELTHAFAAMQHCVGHLVSDSGQGEVPSPYLSAVAFAVPPEEVAEVNSWYEDEHVEMLLAAEGWLRIRRYEVVEERGMPFSHLALHDLANREVMDSAEAAAARGTPWRMALAQRDWFTGSGRWLGSLEQRAGAPARQSG